LLPSSIRFIDIQDRISEIPAKTGFALNPMEILKSAVHQILGDYDYVLIDCPPNLGFITRNGIEISDYYLIPTISDTLSTYGIPQIIRTINQFTKDRPLKITCLGLVITKFDSRSNSHARGRRNLPVRFTKIFGDLGIAEAPIFETVMPQANATSEAMEFTNSPVSFKRKYGYSRSGDRPLHEYVTDLAREFMNHAQ
jgi:chromosome partitioning protein